MHLSNLIKFYYIFLFTASLDLSSESKIHEINHTYVRILFAQVRRGFFAKNCRWRKDLIALNRISSGGIDGKKLKADERVGYEKSST